MNINNQNTISAWDNHYKKEKSNLIYPDENLVRILSKLNLKNATVLDFGSGSGRHIPLLLEYGFEVTALDFSEESIRVIEKKFPSIKKIFSVSNQLTIPDGYFDLIVSWGALHYNSLEQSKILLYEKKRSLKKGGYLVGTIRSSNDTYFEFNLNQKIQSTDLTGSNFYRYSLEQVRDLLGIFSEVLIGYTERCPLGQLDKRICHWVFQVKN